VPEVYFQRDYGSAMSRGRPSTVRRLFFAAPAVVLLLLGSAGCSYLKWRADLNGDGFFETDEVVGRTPPEALSRPCRGTRLLTSQARSTLRLEPS
jgi:hypothetical protein